MKNFKSFSPKADKQRRLVMTRFHAGKSSDVNSFCYQITRITKQGTVDKKFKPLFAYGTDDFDSVKEFKHSGSHIFYNMLSETIDGLPTGYQSTKGGGKTTK